MYTSQFWPKKNLWKLLAHILPSVDVYIRNQHLQKIFCVWGVLKSSATRFITPKKSSWSLSLLCISMAIFPSGTGWPLVSTGLFPFWMLLELRMMEVMVTAGAIRCAKLQSIITTNKPTPSFLQARSPSCRSTTSVRALKERFMICISVKICYYNPVCTLLTVQSLLWTLWHHRTVDWRVRNVNTRIGCRMIIVHKSMTAQQVVNSCSFVQLDHHVIVQPWPQWHVICFKIWNLHEVLYANDELHKAVMEACLERQTEGQKQFGL